MSDTRPKLIRSPSLGGPDPDDLAGTFWQLLCSRVPPADRLTVVGYLLAGAVADQVGRVDWPTLRHRLNDVLGGAVASGLDHGYKMPGHGAILDARMPMDRGDS